VLGTNRLVANRKYQASRLLHLFPPDTWSFPAMKLVHSIDYSDAKRAVTLIVEKATPSKKAAAIAVADCHGDLIYFVRMDGAPISSIQIAMNKAWTAARERKPTKEIGDKVKHPEKAHDIAYYGDPKYVGWGGGIPVWKNGEVIGAVAVSGLSSSEDIELAKFGADLISGS
jgi:glc operon protein GlcG